MANRITYNKINKALLLRSKVQLENMLPIFKKFTRKKNYISYEKQIIIQNIPNSNEMWKMTK